MRFVVKSVFAQAAENRSFVSFPFKVHGSKPCVMQFHQRLYHREFFPSFALLMHCCMKIRVTESRLCGTALSYMLEPRGVGMNDGDTVFFRSPEERERKSRRNIKGNRWIGRGDILSSFDAVPCSDN